MSSVAFIEERVLFSPDIPAEVNNLLQAAVAASSVDQSQGRNTCFYRRKHWIAIVCKLILRCINFISSKNVSLMQNGLFWRSGGIGKDKAVFPTIIVNWLETFRNGTCMPMNAACFICIP